MYDDEIIVYAQPVRYASLGAYTPGKRTHLEVSIYKVYCRGKQIFAGLDKQACLQFANRWRRAGQRVVTS